MRVPSDTSPEAERVVIEGYRGMSAADKLRQVASLNRALDELATARLRSQYPEMTPRELSLRLAALRLDARIMREVFGWDPADHGL